MKETLRHRQAFNSYLEMGEKRSLVSVASLYEVSEKTVARWSKEFRWQERLREREDRIAAEVEAQTDKTIAERKAKSLKIVEGFEDRVVQLYNEGKIDPESVKDLETLIKLKLLLLGESTENVNINEADPIEKLDSQLAAKSKRRRETCGTEQPDPEGG